MEVLSHPRPQDVSREAAPTRTVGFVTIGQAPRDDMMGEFERVLPAARLIQVGALDDLTDAEVAALAPREGDAVLVSRLRSGREVRLTHHLVEPRVQRCLDRLAAQGVGLSVLLCTGEFPTLAPRGVLLRPRQVLRHVVAAVLDGITGAGSGTARPGSGTRLGPGGRPGPGARLGVLVPDPSQAAPHEIQWSALAPAVAVCASPYGDPDRLAEAGRALRDARVGLVVMDCIGYTRAMQRVIAGATGVPAVLATGAVALVLRELLEGGDHADCQ